MIPGVMAIVFESSSEWKALQRRWMVTKVMKVLTMVHLAIGESATELVMGIGASACKVERYPLCHHERY